MSAIMRLSLNIIVDRGIDRPGQTLPMYELVNQKAAAVADKGVLPLFENDLDSSGGIDFLDLFHLHLLCDRNADSVHDAQSLVCSGFEGR